MKEARGIRARVIAAGLIVFWLVMNVLLWRSEYRPGSEPGGPVPLQWVADKVFTAPDYSTMEILRRGKKIGLVRWAPDVVAQTVTNPESESPSGGFEPEGMISDLSGYHIEIDGGLSDDDTSARIRFDARLELSPDQAVRQAHARWIRRPAVWMLDASVSEELLRVEFRDGEVTWKRTFGFDQLKAPDRLLTDLLGPAAVMPASLLAGLGFHPRQLLGAGLDLEWESRSDWLNLGSSRIRIYRLRARWMNRFDIVLLISRAGEILRITLPGDLELRNEAMIWHD